MGRRDRSELQAGGEHIRSAGRASRDAAPGRARPRRFERPGLRGHRLADPQGGARDIAGRAWTTSFGPVQIEERENALVLEARDDTAGLRLRTEVESLPGGALRARHTLTNVAPAPYLLEGLEITLPLPETATRDPRLHRTPRGRAHAAATPGQRRHVAAGVPSRQARPADSASVIVAGTTASVSPTGSVLAASVAGSGNSLVAVQRSESASATISAGELLLPGEVALLTGDSYTMPWVVFTASRCRARPGGVRVAHLAAHAACPPRASSRSR